MAELVQIKRSVSGVLYLMQYWEDLSTGHIFMTDEIEIVADDIIEFATEFDPQPYHLDPAVAAQSIFGGHCASGWQICALMMRLLVDTMQRDGVSSIGSTEVGALRWLKPVFANDKLHAKIEITDCQVSGSHNNYGVVDCSIDVMNQSGDKVITLTTNILIERRPEANVKA